MTNKNQATKTVTETTIAANKYGSIRDVLKESASVKEQKLKETDNPSNPTQVAYTLGETFKHNGRNVQVVELQAQGVYHVKAMEVPFDTYWINTGESVDITNVNDAE